MKNLIVFLLAALWTITAQATLVSHLETDSFAEVQREIELALQQNQWTRDEVLLVFDIDNTLLTTNQHFGGDAWFGWQESLLFDDTADKSLLVGESFGELLTVQGYLFALGKMSATESNLPQIIQELQQKGRSLLLTSRGHEFRNSTEIALAQNGFQFDQSHQMINASKGIAGKYLPYDLDNPSAYGLTSADLEQLKNRPARQVTYMEGLYMTAGQHKGVMLKTLLHRLGYQPKAIFFVDDHKKHTTNVGITYQNLEPMVYTFNYLGMDGKVKSFQESDKSLVHEKWQLLKSAMGFIFD